MHRGGIPCDSCHVGISQQQFSMLVNRTVSTFCCATRTSYCLKKVQKAFSRGRRAFAVFWLESGQYRQVSPGQVLTTMAVKTDSSCVLSVLQFIHSLVGNTLITPPSESTHSDQFKRVIQYLYAVLIMA